MEISSFQLSEEYPSFFSFVQKTQPSSTISFSNPIKRSKLDDPSIQEILNKFLAFDNIMDDDESKPQNSSIFEENETKTQDSSIFFSPMEENEFKLQDSSIFFNPMEENEFKTQYSSIFFNSTEENETKTLDSSTFFSPMEENGFKPQDSSIFFNSMEENETKTRDSSIFFNPTEENETKTQDSSIFFNPTEENETKTQDSSIFFSPMEENETKTRDSSIFFNPTEENETNTQASSISFNETSSSYFNSYTPGLVPSGSMSKKRSRAEFDNAMPTLAESTSFAKGGAVQRRLWVKDRSTAWWDRVDSPDFTEKEFKDAFRMSRATFDMICNELESAVTKKNTTLRLAIPVRKRVAVCIWKLATGASLRQVSSHFGLGISTCHKLVLEVCTAIRTVLMPKFLQWPDNNKMKDIKKEFEAFSGIPNVGGSIYTTHVPIIAPKVNAASYFNKRHTERNLKTSYSVTVQGVVDHNGAFTDISVGWPGSMTDDQILEKSALFQRANKGALKDVRVVGHSGFPLMDWVMVPYSHPQNLTWAQHAYNEKVEGIQKVAKEAFMRFKGRWNCLQKRTDIKLQELPVVLGACCVLHNICEMMNEGFSENLRFDLFDDEAIPKYSVRSRNAISDRNQIAQKILHQHQQ